MIVRGSATTAAVVLAGSLLVAPTALAEEAPRPTTVARKLVTPLSMDVARDGTVYASQNFAGLLTRIEPGGKPTVVYAAPKGTEVGAIATAGRAVHFATTKGKKTALWEMTPGGRPTRLADLSAYERTKNPDADMRYGFETIDPACAAQVPPEVPVSYTGIVESHPYAATVRRGATYVADAAANAILKVRNGRVSTVAVLPAVPVTITAEAAAANGLPACTAGLTYLFEPVPTDVEVGRGGRLYVSLLPGGPEDGSTGANGQVVSVGMRSGKVRMVAGGLLAATGLAVAKNGDVFVSQLFGGQVSRIRRGSHTARPYAEVMMPAAVEWSRGSLYVSAKVLAEEPKGTILRW